MSTKIDIKNTFKDIMGSYPTGVTVVTTTTQEGINVGLTVNSFASVSLEPTLVLFCVDYRAGSLDAFKEAKKFAIHVLSEDQKDVCFKFAGSDSNKFSNVNWKLSELGVPVIEGAAGIMECK